MNCIAVCLPSNGSCRDPAATSNNTKTPVNCTGIAVNKPNSLLQRLLLPVVKDDVVDVAKVLKSVAPALLQQTTGGAPNGCRCLSRLAGISVV